MRITGDNHAAIICTFVFVENNMVKYTKIAIYFRYIKNESFSLKS